MKAFLLFLLRWLLQTRADFLSQLQRNTHMHIVGATGEGKTMLLVALILQDILASHGLLFIDVHGEAYRLLVWLIAQLPEVWPRVILIDPTDPKWTVSFNPLQPIDDFSSDRLALYLTDVVVKVWGIEADRAPRMVWLLTNSFLALSCLGLSLLDLPRFLLDRNYRESLLPRLTHEGARAYFLLEFPQTTAGVQSWVTPVLNKIGGLIFDQDMQLLLTGHSTINFRSLINSDAIVLVNLPKGIIGEGPSALFAAFIVAHLQKAALARPDEGPKTPFYCYLDEFQNYTTDNIKDILCESRKYHLSLITSHQYVSQLPHEIREAVLGNVGVLISFRVGYQDGLHLAKDIFPSPDFLATTKTRLTLRRFGGLPLPTLHLHQEREGWDRLALKLTQLKHREFWCRRRGSLTPTKHRTEDVVKPVITDELRERRQELIDFSGARYGRLKSQARAEVQRLRELYTQLAASGNLSNNGHPDDELDEWGL